MSGRSTSLVPRPLGLTCSMNSMTLTWNKFIATERSSLSRLKVRSRVSEGQCRQLRKQHRCVCTMHGENFTPIDASRDKDGSPLIDSSETRLSVQVGAGRSPRGTWSRSALEVLYSRLTPSGSIPVLAVGRANGIGLTAFGTPMGRVTLGEDQPSNPLTGMLKVTVSGRESRELVPLLEPRFRTGTSTQ